MLSATGFYYNNIFSGNFGLVIASRDEDSFQETSPFNSTIHAIKTPLSNRFNFTGRDVEEMPSYAFSVYTADGSALSAPAQREILVWIEESGKSGFKKLQFIQSEYSDLDYLAIFSSTNKIYHLGNCVGFSFNVTFNSQFAMGRETKVVVDGKYPDTDGGGYRCKKSGGAFIYPKIINNSDMLEYVYPVIKFEPASEQTAIIVNDTDNKATGDVDRRFEFKLYANEKITIDNELKFVGSNPEDTAIGGNRLGDFNLNWFRCLRGVNTLKIKLDGVCTITCPQYVLIGF